MSVVAKRLVLLALSHGMQPASIWEMTLAEFADAIAAARRGKTN